MRRQGIYHKEHDAPDAAFGVCLGKCSEIAGIPCVFCYNNLAFLYSAFTFFC